MPKSFVFGELVESNRLIRKVSICIILKQRKNKDFGNEILFVEVAGGYTKGKPFDQKITFHIISKINVYNSSNMYNIASTLRRVLID